MFLEYLLCMFINICEFFCKVKYNSVFDSLSKKMYILFFVLFFYLVCDNNKVIYNIILFKVLKCNFRFIWVYIDFEMFCYNDV